jgi:kinetochore protein Spc25
VTSITNSLAYTDQHSALQSERHTLADIQSSLTHIRQVLSKTKDQSAALEAELSAVRKDVTSQRSEKARQESSLKEMRSKDAVELDELEKVLGWSVVGVRREYLHLDMPHRSLLRCVEDELLNQFTLIDPNEPEREFSFVIDISKEDYSG